MQIYKYRYLILADYRDLIGLLAVFCLFVFHLCCPNGISPMGNSSCFPGKSQLQQSRATQPTVVWAVFNRCLIVIICSFVRLYPEATDAVNNNNNNDNNDNNNNNNEILIKRKPLVYTRARDVVQKKRRLGQYNSNNKLTHGQYTSRYN